MPFQPPIKDKAGRGTLCALIDNLAKEMIRRRPEGTSPDPEDFQRVAKRLDEARAKFHRLYGHTPRPQEE